MRSPNAHAAGFTLLELVGVLAVLAIMAGVLAPSVVQLLDEGYRASEAENLRTVSDSLARYVRSTKQIPSTVEADWSDAVAQFAALSPSKVLVNPKNHNRRLYADRMFFSNVNQPFNGYVQDQGLSSAPYSPRLMLVSSLTGDVRVALRNHAEFEAVWDQTAGARLVEDDDLLIERVNLAPLFHRVVLNNSASAQAGYRLEGGTEGAIAAAAGSMDGSRTVFVIADTQLGLNDAPYPGGSLLRQTIVRSDYAARFELDGLNWHWVD